MDLHEDLKELLRSLNSTGVEYLIIGAFAVAYYGRPRLTGDLDLFARPSSENAERLLLGLRQFSEGGIDFDPEDFARDERMLRIGREPNRVDILSSISAVSFDEAWANRVAAEVGGVPVSFISLEQLIRNKKATGRLKDAADVDELTNGTE